MEGETEKFKVRLKGLSHDRRTNEWYVTCKKCNTTHTPPTTMIAYQTITCPNKKCGEQETINYNSL